MAEHDDETTAWDRPTDEATAVHRARLRDPGALLVGAWFAMAGVLAVVLGEPGLDDVPPVMVPASFSVVGLGLLLPKRAR